MGISNSVLRRVNAIPQALPGMVSRKHRRVTQPISFRKSARSMSVGELLSPNRPLPEQTILLGCCADGLPFLMSMDDPDMGAILISGGRGCGKTHQLQVMAEGVIKTNKPHDLQITVISHDPSIWEGYLEDRHQAKYFQGVYAWYDPSVEEHIQHLTEMVEARRAGRQSGPANLVILDDMVFVEILSSEAQVNLRWLLEYGSQSQVWLVAAMNALHAEKLPFWLEVFRTRIFGWMRDGLEGKRRRPTNGWNPEAIEPGTFRAWTGGSWISYRLPLLGNGLPRKASFQRF